MKADNIEKLKQISERVDNLVNAMKLGIPAYHHVEGLKVALPEIKKQIDAVCLDEENN
ncbi:hypothetical protein [Rufibacter soli]